MDEEILKYADYLFSFALKKCGNLCDAEDLASETILAAYEYLNRGKTISNVKAWLSSTLSHKWNDILRKKYKLPTVSIDIIPDDFRINENDNINEYYERPTAEQVRREVAYLAQLQRTVIIKHYFEGKKAEAIAKELNIPKGTVLSRLSSGRKQMQKGFETMEKYGKQSYNPDRLDISCHGNPGVHGEPWSIVSEDILKQNILIVAYQKPLKIIDIAQSLGVPTPYIESAVKSLVRSELMGKIGEKYFTDFLIATPEDLLKCLDEEIIFANQYYGVIWSCISNMLNDIRKMTVYNTLGEHEKISMEYYAILDTFSRGIYLATKEIINVEEVYPDRPDGGSWIAQGTLYPSNFDFSTYRFGEYCYGGERRAYLENFSGSKSIDFHVYDTQPDLNKYQNGPIEIHEDNLCKMLYIIHNELSFENIGFNLLYLKDIPHLVECGVLKYQNNHPKVAIPVINKKQYEELTDIILIYIHKLSNILATPFHTLFPKIKINIPHHLEGRIAEFRRYSCYSIPMAVIKKAIVNKDFYESTDHPSPPMILVIDKQ